jgi:tyrosine decarboxylase/aspartate 1-decarboxylase
MNTIGVFTSAGTTYLGQVDPIDEISEVTAEKNIPLHVDAAFGGFVIPFLREIGLGDYQFDFSVEGVTSISSDPHKMGFAPIPSGTLLFRSKKLLKSITTKRPYLQGIGSNQATLLETRPAASILATWAVMKHLGRLGYRKIVTECMMRTRNAVERVSLNPLLDLVIQPIMNIVAIKSREVSIEKIMERMERRGWKMASSPKPPSIRLVVMPHVTMGALNAFFNDLDDTSTIIPAD